MDIGLRSSVVGGLMASKRSRRHNADRDLAQSGMFWRERVRRRPVADKRKDGGEVQRLGSKVRDFDGGIHYWSDRDATRRAMHGTCCRRHVPIALNSVGHARIDRHTRTRFDRGRSVVHHSRRTAKYNGERQQREEIC